MHLLGGTEFSLDGCKLPSNASRRWSGTFATLKEKKEKIARRVAYLLAEHVEADSKEGMDRSEETRKAKQVEKLKQQAARIEQFLETNQPKRASSLRKYKAT